MKSAFGTDAELGLNAHFESATREIAFRPYICGKELPCFRKGESRRKVLTSNEGTGDGLHYLSQSLLDLPKNIAQTLNGGLLNFFSEPSRLQAATYTYSLSGKGAEEQGTLGTKEGNTSSPSLEFRKESSDPHSVPDSEPVSFSSSFHLPTRGFGFPCAKCSQRFDSKIARIAAPRPRKSENSRRLLESKFRISQRISFRNAVNFRQTHGRGSR